MKRYLLIFSILLLFISACKKTAVVKPVLNPVADYLPLTTGTTWTYSIGSANGGPSYGTIQMTVSGGQIQRDGKAFSVITPSSATFNFYTNYYYKTGGNYKSYYAIIPDRNDGTQNFDVPILLTGATNTRDTSYFIPNTDPSKPAAYQIISSATLQEFSDETINGKAYKNVITTGVSILKLYDGTDPKYAGDYYLYQDYEFDFAPGVGIIAEYFNGYALTLTSYDIK
jgi:hypothetical protein